MSDNKPMDYVDEDGVQWVMAACGHRAGGSVTPGDKIAACPNCMFLARFGGFEVVYPERLPDEVREALSVSEPTDDPLP